MSRFAGLSLAVISGAALAADPAGDDTDDERTTYFETATVRQRALSSATASVTVFGREEIDALNVLSVSELMRFIPGVDVVTSGSRGGPAFAQIQGGDPNFTIVLLDGVPLNDITDQLGGAVNLNSLSARQVERVEVVRGPVSSFFGSTGLAGVVNIITRRGTTDKPAVVVEASAGDAEVRQAAVSVSQGKDRQDYFVGVNWEQEQGRIADDAFEQYSVKGNYRRAIGRQSSMRIAGRVTSWDTSDYPEGSGGLLGSGEVRDSENEEASLGLQFLLGRQERQQKVYANVLRHELTRTSPPIFNAGDPAASVPPSVENTDYLHAIAGWALPVISRERTRLTVGLEAHYEDGQSRSTLFIPAPLPTSYEIDRWTGAGLIEFLAERGPWLIEVGARIDSPEGFDTQFSPRAGFAYRFNERKTRLRLSAGRAFKLPSFYALANPVVGNPDLNAETTVGGDLGIEHEFEAARVSTSFSIFAYDYEDLVDFVSDPFPSLINRDRVTTRGAALSVDWRASDRIAFRFNVTRQNVEDTDTGETLVHRPDWYGGARFSWQATDRVRWEVDGQWVTESVDLQLPLPQRDTVDGYGLLGTALQVRLASSWFLDARINNLLDETYETLIGFPGPERNYRVGIRFQTR